MDDKGFTFPHNDDYQEFKESLAYTEKMRAALSRREPAIRDFFDLFFAYSTLKFDFFEENFIQMVKQKLSIPGNGPIDLSLHRKRQLIQQTKTNLQSVLRPLDYSNFDIEKSFHFVSTVAKYL